MTTSRMTKAAERLRAMQDKAERRMSQILSGEVHGSRPVMQPPASLKPQQQPQAARQWISPQEMR